MQIHLKKLFTGHSLSQEEAAAAMDILMTGQAPPEQVGAFLGVLRGRGESINEIVGCVRSMRQHAKPFKITRTDLIDTCGTGGDSSGTFNISTACAFVLAGASLGVVKHGNRSVSSLCGSADVLEALGINIDLPVDAVQRQVDEIGFGFLFARSFHPAMKNVAPIRASLGVRTVFNLLGPLTSPAATKRQIIGVYDRHLLEKLAYVLKELGSDEVMLVTGADGLDEISLCSETHVAHLKGGQVKSYIITPEDVGLTRCDPLDLKGGDARQNAQIIEQVLNGKKGAPRDVVLLNAAAALLVAGKASSLREGKDIAAAVIDSGKAGQVLIKVRSFKP